MSGEIGALLNSPWFDRGLAVVLVFVLLRMMHEDIGKLTTAVAALASELSHSQGAIVARQEEIRKGLREILQFWMERFQK